MTNGLTVVSAGAGPDGILRNLNKRTEIILLERLEVHPDDPEHRVALLLDGISHLNIRRRGTGGLHLCGAGLLQALNFLDHIDNRKHEPNNRAEKHSKDCEACKNHLQGSPRSIKPKKPATDGKDNPNSYGDLRCHQFIVVVALVPFNNSFDEANNRPTKIIEEKPNSNHSHHD